MNETRTGLGDGAFAGGFAVGAALAVLLFLALSIIFSPDVAKVRDECDQYGAAIRRLPGRDLVILCQPISDNAYDAQMKALARTP